MRIKGLGLAAFSKLLLQRRKVNHRRNVFICVADHFEPDWGGASETLRRERVQRWVDQYPISVEGIRDSRGRVPQHTFFYPLEEYRSELIDGLAELCHSGYGDVEVHLHHQDDTEENLFKQLDWFRRTLYHKHNLLRTDRKGQIRFGFIHGNWALCNSLPDGAWCGVNDEIRVLREAGCYADFTLPAAPSPAQTSSVNRIYYAHSDANRPKAHDTGPAATVGVPPVKDALLMIPGPLALDWSSRKKLCIPSLENADLSASRPPAPSRISNWERASVTVKGRPDWLFVKLHTHGAKEDNANQLLGPNMRRLHEALAKRAECDPNFRYYYVTAYELAQLVHAAERCDPDPELFLNRLAAQERLSPCEAHSAV